MLTPGVVDQDVDRPEPALDLAHQALDLGRDGRRPRSTRARGGPWRRRCRRPPAWQESSERPASATSAPASASAWAITRPSPRPPPVTSARRPSRRNRSSTFMFGSLRESRRIARAQSFSDSRANAVERRTFSSSRSASSRGRASMTRGSGSALAFESRPFSNALETRGVAAAEARPVLVALVRDLERVARDHLEAQGQLRLSLAAARRSSSRAGRSPCLAAPRTARSPARTGAAPCP